MVIANTTTNALLKRLRDERTLYLFENCRDLDYMNDQEMEEILKSVQLIKMLKISQGKIKQVIQIDCLGLFFKKDRH